MKIKEEEEEEAMDMRFPRKLDFNAPFLSTRRPNCVTIGDMSNSNTQSARRDGSSRVPFSWEQIPGKPKETDTNDTVVPPPKLPPGRWHPPKEATSEENGESDRGHQDDGCGDIDDNDNDDVFTDANEKFSLSDVGAETTDKDNVLRAANLHIESWCSQKKPNFMIQRFIPDAKALAASSALTFSKNVNKKLPISCTVAEGCVSRAVRQSYSSPKGCGLDIFFPWRIKHTRPCGVKSPIRATSLNAVKPQWGTKPKRSRE
ncbi:unnamed protein product [Ilex paraguariensis]|uniref:Uncharacterized protein n=1 Tax=Ilex paraguariensis TaxID=185542 RepID=A0ABC8UPX2_9AQUA